MPAQEESREARSASQELKLSKTANRSLAKALQMMDMSGYGIRGHVRVLVDPNLGFMGYTFPGAGKFSIVVSGAAVESGLLEGLLVHELSHVYRMERNHPSHSGEIINEVMSMFEKRGLDRDYQQKILHDLVNHLEDLYADDITFKVFGKTSIFPLEEGSRFFLSWLSPEPVTSDNIERDRWVNMAMMLRNTFALANMARHGIPDIEDRAARLNERFLSGLPADSPASFEYFHTVMMNLKENVTDDDFRRVLGEYLGKFVELAQGEPHPNRG